MLLVAAPIASIHTTFQVETIIMDKIDEQIASLREGNTLTENEVKALCDKVTSHRQSCGVS